MNINKLFAYIDKKGIAYKKQQLTCDYFENVSINYIVCAINLEYNDLNELKAARKMIEKYCTRYNFEIYNQGRLNKDIYGLWHEFMSIITPGDAAAVDLYNFFAKEAINDFEIFHHNICIRNLNNSHYGIVNHAARCINAKYEKLYLQSINAA